jgi:hypothetical protein
MNFLLIVLQFLLGVIRRDDARLEPILARTDGRTSPPSRRDPLEWIPGWGWMISSASILQRGTRQRRPAARSGGSRTKGSARREDRPPSAWRDR